MEYYDLNTTQKSEIKNILDNNLYVLANELGNELFFNSLEDGDVTNYECDEDGEYPEIMQWWIVSDWLADKLIEDGKVVNQTKGINLWGRCGCGYALECDFVSIYKSLA